MADRHTRLAWRGLPRSATLWTAPSFHAGQNVPALDGIRGLAILLVVVFHAFQTSQLVLDVNRHWLDRAVNQVAMAGWAGVDLFFVLSGFLITGILHDSRGSSNYFRVFYLRRAVRIFPLYYAVLALHFVVLPAVFPFHESLREATQGQFWSWSYLSNVGIAVSGWGTPSPYLNHLWSLAIEEQFYLLWPLVVFTLSRRAVMRVCLVAVAGSLALRSIAFLAGEPTAAYVLTPMRMDALAVGAWLALAAREPRLCSYLAAWCRPACLLLGAALLGLLLWRGALDVYDPAVGTLGLTVLALFFGALLFMGATASPPSAVASLFNASGLRALGRYSYGVYVFHWPVILLLGESGVLAGLLSPGAGLALHGQIGFTLLAMGVSMAAALLSWCLLEERFLRLKSRFAYRPAANPPPVGVDPCPSPVAPAGSLAEMGARP